MVEKSKYRAYVNAQPALSEAAQLALVAAYNPEETYSETRGETRDYWLRSLRGDAIALLPELFVLAKATGRKDSRLSDLLMAKDEIHDAGIAIVEASSGLRSDDRAQWRKMLARATDMLGGAVKAGKVGKKPLGYTDDQLRTLRAIMDSRHYNNWHERRDAMMMAGVKPPGRSWCYTVLPTLTNRLLQVEKPVKLPKRRPSRVYFLRDGDKVKIGHSMDVAARMRALKTHTDLKLLLTLPGGPAREAELHRQFAKYKIKGTKEWFALVPAITKYIAVCKRHKSR